MPSLVRATAAVLLLLMGSRAAAAVPVHPYVSYEFFETRRTASDHRQCLTQIFLTADDYVGYRHREDVYGSIEPTVKSVEFSNEYRRKATAAEQAGLVRALLAAKVFELTADPPSPEVDYSCNLDVRINTQDKRVHFASPPRSSARRAVHDIMLRFAKRLKVDWPADLAEATTITEGDRQPARKVKLAEVIAHPDAYHGKRISVVGYYHGEFEGSSLSVDQYVSEKRDYKRSVWQSSASTFADRSAVQVRNNSWLRVEGVFLRGPGGHLGLWPGEVTRLTHVEPVPKPE